MANSFQQSIGAAPQIADIPSAAVVDPSAGTSGFSQLLEGVAQGADVVFGAQQAAFKSELTGDLEAATGGVDVLSPGKQDDSFGAGDPELGKIRSMGARLKSAQASGQVSSTEVLARLEQKVADASRANPLMASRYRAAFSEARGDFSNRLALLNQQASASAGRRTKIDKYQEELQLRSLKTGFSPELLMQNDQIVARAQEQVSVEAAQGKVQGQSLAAANSNSLMQLTGTWDAQAYAAGTTAERTAMEQAQAANIEQYRLRAINQVNNLRAQGLLDDAAAKAETARISSEADMHLKMFETKSYAKYTEQLNANIKQTDIAKMHERFPVLSAAANANMPWFGEFFNKIADPLAQAIESGDPNRLQGLIDLYGQSPIGRAVVTSMQAGGLSPEQAAKVMSADAVEGIKHAGKTGAPHPDHGEMAYRYTWHQLQKPEYAVETAEGQKRLDAMIPLLVQDPLKVEAMLATPAALSKVLANPGTANKLKTALNAQAHDLARLALGDREASLKLQKGLGAGGILGVSARTITEQAREAQGKLASDRSIQDLQASGATYGRIYEAVNPGKSWRKAVKTALSEQVAAGNYPLTEDQVIALSASLTAGPGAVPNEEPQVGIVTSLAKSMMRQSTGAPVSGQEATPSPSTTAAPAAPEAAAQEPILDAKQQQLSDLIGTKESNGNYNAYYNHADSQIPFTTMTIQEVLEWQDAHVTSGKPSSAVGKYQIIRKTLEEMADRLDLDESTVLFDEETQDRMFKELLERRGYKKFARGGNSVAFANKLAKEWASFPVVSGPKTGLSYYDTGEDSLNRALISPEEVLRALDG